MARDLATLLLLPIIFGTASVVYENTQLKVSLADQIASDTSTQLETLVSDFAALDSDGLALPCMQSTGEGVEHCSRELLARWEAYDRIVLNLAWKMDTMPLSKETLQAWEGFKSRYWGAHGTGGWRWDLRFAMFGHSSAGGPPAKGLQHCGGDFSSADCAIATRRVAEVLSSMKTQLKLAACRSIRDIKKYKAQRATEADKQLGQKIRAQLEHPGSRCAEIAPWDQ